MEGIEIRFSIFYEHQLPRPWDEGAEQRLYSDALEQVEIADRLGYDCVWEVEHHFLEEYSHSSAPEVFLAAASQRTKRIRLGHGIVQVPAAVNHPARVAERIATLDIVSGGRVDFGSGEGSSAAELGGFGFRRSEKRAMWQDSMDAITRMLVEEPFAGWDSPYLQMPPRNVLPKPVQRPHPPLWVACSRRETIRFAAKNGIGALSFSFVEPSDAAQWVTDYYRLLDSPECVPVGFAVNPSVSVILPMMCHEDERTAIERGIDGAHFFAYSLAHYYGSAPHDPGRTDVWADFEAHRVARGFNRDAILAGRGPLSVNIGSLRGAIGTPDQIADLVARYEEAGVDQVIFVCQAGRNRHDHICESLELVGKSVIPRFAEGREEKERAKAERLAPAIEAALARREPARTPPAGYRIDEDAELTAARRARRARVTLAGRAVALRDGAQGAVRTRLRRAVGRYLQGHDDAVVERRFGPGAQWFVFSSMARAYDPSVAPGFAGEVEYRLSRSTGPAMAWTLDVRGSRARAHAGPAANRLIGVRVGAVDFLRLLAGEVGPAALLMDGRLEVDGDVVRAARIGEMFGGPSPY